MAIVLRAALAAVLTASLLGCGAADDQDAPAAEQTSSATPAYDDALHDELVAMLAEDVEERTSGLVGEGDAERTERLKEIIAEHGWPTISLVGEDGEEAAWTIAQHSDLDPDFQAEALDLLRAAVESGEASPGNLAYLEDRVAVSAWEPQTYGTQVSCGRRGPTPRTPIADRADVDERREAAGLEPLAAYFDEMAGICGG